MLLTLQRFLRAPRTIFVELAGLTLAGVVGAVYPQIGGSTPPELEPLRRSGTWASALADWLGLEHVFQSPWFLGLALMAAASLALVISEQIKRGRRTWSKPLGPAQFRSAPLRAEFERPSRLALAETRVQTWAEKQFGLAGSVVFHTGLLLVIIAGALRALFASEAVVDMIEWETLAPTSQAWAAQWPGHLAAPFRLAQPVTLRSLETRCYSTGDLRELSARLVVGGVEQSVAINHDLVVGGRRLHLGTDYGLAALLEWRSSEAVLSREAVLLARNGPRAFEGVATGRHDLKAYLRSQLDGEGYPTAAIEVRVMNGAVLLRVAELRVGDTMVLPSGEGLKLAGVPLWARLRGSYDPALWLAYAGFGFVLAGAALLFGVIPVAACLVVTPLGERERVFVALKPFRFAPLFQDRFERWVAHEGGAGYSSTEDGEGRKQPACSSRLVLRGLASGETDDTSNLPEANPSLARLPMGLKPSQTALLLCLLPVVLTACGRPSIEQARALVERYNRVVSEAYRRGDVRLVDAVVGPKEGKKLAGLIGVRNDLGITLDSELLSLRITGIQMADAGLEVLTKERWRYRDLRIGTGEQVGEASLDSYEMLYRFKRIAGAWLVDEIRFTAPPQVGRKQTPWLAQRPAAHGPRPLEPAAGGNLP